MTSKPSYQELEEQLAEVKKQNSILKNNLFSNTEVQNEYLNNILNTIADPVFVKDDESRLLLVNDAFCEIFGVTRENAFGKTLTKDVFADKKDLILKIDKEVIATGVENISEETFKINGGEAFTLSIRKTRFIDSKGKRFLVGIIRDITERITAEEEIRISEEQFRSFFTQSHIGSAMVGLDKRFIKCNKAFCDFLGYSEEELLGKTIADFTHPDDLQIGMSDMKRIAMGEIESARVEKRYIKKNKSVVWGELSISVIRDDKNKPLYFIPIIQNITERKGTELALNKQKAELKTLNATKDKLFSIIAHDLRTPFLSIIGFSSILANRVTDAKQKEFVFNIDSSAKNALALLDNLLKWAQAQTGRLTIRKEKLQLSDLVKKTIEISEPAANIKNVSLNIANVKNFEIYADRNMVVTILLNIVSNAIKFTESGGRINISTQSKDNQVQVSVTDNGIGMCTETVQNLFDVNTNITTPGTNDEKGSGLGLVLCKEFIDRLDGNIWAESTEGEGSKIKFTLPVTN